MTPIETMERLQQLPEHLRAHHRRFIVEAVSEETKAPMIEFYRQQELATEAAQAWAKANGAEGFYPPNPSHGSAPSSVYCFSFKTEAAPSGPAWTKAGRHWVARRGYVAMYPSKRPAGKAITADLAILPKFPGYGVAYGHLGNIEDLRTEKSSSGVGYSDGKMHFTVPCRIGERFFVSAVNHNYDILRDAENAAEYLAGDHPEWASPLDYKDDPIGWRPGTGWAFLTKIEFDFIIAEARLSAARERIDA